MRKIFILIISITFVLQSCDDKKSSDGNLRGFNNEVLENWMNNIIYPSYLNYQNKAQNLVTKAETFESSPNETNFTELKESWLEAYKAYQKTILFDIQIAENSDYIKLSNSYPTKIQKKNPSDMFEISGIEENIKLVEEGKKNEISLAEKNIITANYKYQGFPALDYLLFANGKDLSYYKNNKAARTYVKMLTQALKTNIDKVVSFWSSKKNIYINSSDQSITGSYSSTINAFVRIYESRIRAEKIGLACGAIPNQYGNALTNNIEAYYNPDPKIAKELLRVALQSSQDFFNGKHFNSNAEGKSLKSILKELGRDKLIQDIEKQYKDIFRTLDEIPATESIKELASRGQSKSDIRDRELYPLFLSMQKNVGNFKRRMLQEALNAQIDYSDGDGD